MHGSLFFCDDCSESGCIDKNWDLEFIIPYLMVCYTPPACLQFTLERCSPVEFIVVGPCDWCSCYPFGRPALKETTNAAEVK